LRKKYFLPKEKPLQISDCKPTQYIKFIHRIYLIYDSIAFECIVSDVFEHIGIALLTGRFCLFTPTRQSVRRKRRFAENKKNPQTNNRLKFNDNSRLTTNSVRVRLIFAESKYVGRNELVRGFNLPPTKYLYTRHIILLYTCIPHNTARVYNIIGIPYSRRE